MLKFATAPSFENALRSSRRVRVVLAAEAVTASRPTADSCASLNHQRHQQVICLAVWIKIGRKGKLAPCSRFRSCRAADHPSHTAFPVRIRCSHRLISCPSAPPWAWYALSAVSTPRAEASSAPPPSTNSSTCIRSSRPAFRDARRMSSLSSTVNHPGSQNTVSRPSDSLLDDGRQLFTQQGLNVSLTRYSGRRVMRTHPRRVDGRRVRDAVEA